MIQNLRSEPPRIRNQEACEQFRAAVRRLGMDPDGQWAGGYVEYEWGHCRHVLEQGGIELAGRNVLEFGCNIGATSIVLAALGAAVTGVDVNPEYVGLARLNAASYGLGESIAFLQVSDSTRLPIADGQFDLVSCNSVLEYVPHGSLAGVQSEIDRTLKPGGIIAVSGTSNRLWPREVHSRRWLVNYLPHVVDRLVGTEIQRGVYPWLMRSGFGPRYSDLTFLDRGRGYIAARERMGTSAGVLMLMRGAIGLFAPLGISPGLLTPSISVLLRKDERSTNHRC